MIRATTVRMCSIALFMILSGGCRGPTDPGKNDPAKADPAKTDAAKTDAAKTDGGQSATGQIVAHVGNQVITTLELDNEMRLANVAFEKRSDPAVIKQALNEMVLRKYLVQQAQNAKLDQEPNVLLDVMRSRDQVMANAFMARKIASTSISAEDIDGYIAQNPAKFVNRQVMTVDQIRFALLPNANEVIDASKSARSLDEIETRLTLRQIPHLRSIGKLTEADLPEATADTLHNRKPDDIFFGRLGSNGLYFKVKDTQPGPLVGVAARTFARQALAAAAAKKEFTVQSAAAMQEVKYSTQYSNIMKVETPPAAAVTPAQQ